MECGRYNGSVPFAIHRDEARSILTPTSGFIRDARFSHSLTPARKCTFGCTYCYVPTMGIYGGLKPAEWQNWGRFTMFKSNAAALLRGLLRPGQAIYCSPVRSVKKKALPRVRLAANSVKNAALQSGMNRAFKWKSLRECELARTVPGGAAIAACAHLGGLRRQRNEHR